MIKLEGDKYVGLLVHMSNKSKAKNFLEDLMDDDLKQEIEKEQVKKSSPSEQFVVYFIGDNPDTVWQYFHKPEEGGEPYGRLYGYWDTELMPNGKDTSRKFVEHKSKNLKLMDWDTFIDRVPPNKDCIKVYDSEADFLLELI